MSSTESPSHFARPPARISAFNRPVVEEFRANGGRVGGMFEGGDLLLLTTVGASSGIDLTTPLAYVEVDGRLLVVASAGGAPDDPQWYRNLLAHPMVRVELGTETYEAVAVPTEGAERDRLFAAVAAREPGFADYQAKADRRLPVVAIERTHGEEVDVLADGFAAKLIQIHTWLRTQLAHVRAEADAHFATRAGDASERPTVGLSLQIRQHCLAFCQGLEFHHTGEDAAVFPDLARRFPELGEVLDRLRQEHRTVERIRRELEALLASMDTADPERFRSELARMTEELEAHLDGEEEALLPVLSALAPG